MGPEPTLPQSPLPIPTWILTSAGAKGPLLVGECGMLESHASSFDNAAVGAGAICDAPVTVALGPELTLSNRGGVEGSVPGAAGLEDVWRVAGVSLPDRVPVTPVAVAPAASAPAPVAAAPAPAAVAAAAAAAAPVAPSAPRAAALAAPLTMEDQDPLLRGPLGDSPPALTTPLAPPLPSPAPMPRPVPEL